jgi:hypothetical protein
LGDKNLKLKARLSGLFFFVILGVLAFQNCGPAVLSGSADSSSASPGPLDSVITPESSTTFSTTSTTLPPEQVTTIMTMTQSSQSVVVGQALNYSIRFLSPPLPRRHRVWVHFINPETNTHDFQDDFDPAPDVTQWTLGQVMTFNRSIKIPTMARGSRYLVSVGLYDIWTDPVQWSSWPVTVGTGVVRDSQGRNIVGALNVIQVVQAENMAVNSNEGSFQEARTCVPATGEVTVGGACLWGTAVTHGVDGNSGPSRGVGSFKVSVAGQYNIQIFASGAPALGVWPELEISINGTKVGQQTVNTTDAAKSYTFTTTLTAGTHTIMINFPNDFYNPNVTPAIDRNLFVDKTHIYLK